MSPVERRLHSFPIFPASSRPLALFFCVFGPVEPLIGGMSRSRLFQWFSIGTNVNIPAGPPVFLLTLMFPHCRYEKPETYSVAEVPVPTLRDNDVLVMLPGSPPALRRPITRRDSIADMRWLDGSRSKSKPAVSAVPTCTFTKESSLPRHVDPVWFSISTVELTVVSSSP